MYITAKVKRDEQQSAARYLIYYSNFSETYCQYSQKLFINYSYLYRYMNNNNCLLVLSAVS